ncbi:hypothetical protein M426DRAFT_251987 [Hypoxylon sp. CI-4A]|nr:hypothetical protein M426DRAFT_251987 [Hypoxylon sp. CI-4A]
MKPINPITFIFTLWLSQPAAATLSKTGNITLFSDTNCQEPVYVNSFILGIDTCGKENAATPFLETFGSYILNERPWCDNGDRPWLAIFGDSTCDALIAVNRPTSLADEEASHPCVVPGGFKGMAFMCDGLDGDDEGTSDDASTGTSSEATVTRTAHTVSETSSSVTSTVTMESVTTGITSAPLVTISSGSTSSSAVESLSSTSSSTVTPTSSSSTSSMPSTTPVQTAAAAPAVSKGVLVKLVLCFSILATLA